MASIYLGLNRGQSSMNPFVVTEGASTGSTDVELRIDTGKGLTRLEVTYLTDALLRYLQDSRTNVLGL